MKNHTFLLAWTIIGLALTASVRVAVGTAPPTLGQSVYTAYTFTTLAENAGYGSADGTGNANWILFPTAGVFLDLVSQGDGN
jgi:hypothetical protein